MKIALPVNNDSKIDGHFGHCKYYNVYTITENNKVDRVERIDSPQGCGCKSDIASVLAQMGVSVMLAGGIGNGAVNVLNNAGIEVIRGCSGNIDEVVAEYLNGNISDNGINCQHHEHHTHAHNCHH